jgi:hypothetical protein
MMDSGAIVGVHSEDGVLPKAAAHRDAASTEQEQCSTLCVCESVSHQLSVFCDGNKLSVVEDSKVLQGLLDEYNGETVKVNVPFTQQSVSSWLSIRSGNTSDLETVAKAIQVSTREVYTFTNVKPLKGAIPAPVFSLLRVDPFKSLQSEQNSVSCRPLQHMRSKPSGSHMKGIII